MLTRRHQILASAFGLMVFATAAAVQALRGNGYLSVTMVVLAAFFAWSLNRRVRERVVPPLTVERLRGLRLEATSLGGLALAFAGFLFTVADRTPHRTFGITMAIVMIALSLAAGVSVWRMTRMIARGEIPEKVRRRYDSIVRRRES